jgi:hypothetical protein
MEIAQKSKLWNRVVKSENAVGDVSGLMRGLTHVLADPLSKGTCQGSSGRPGPVQEHCVYGNGQAWRTHPIVARCGSYVTSAFFRNSQLIFGFRPAAKVSFSARVPFCCRVRILLPRALEMPDGQFD